MSGPLVPSSSGGGFAQQGQLDWVAFSKHTVSFSVELLARWSKAGIEPLTIMASQGICQRFVLPPETQKKLDEALACLETFPAFNKVLSFGFGVRYVVDKLNDTEQGAALVILCASLNAFYPTFFCAQVLRELCRVSEAPQELTPALSQWIALIDVCSGVLSKTNFLLLVRGLERYISPASSVDPRIGLYPTDAGALAKALVILSQISNGSLVHVKFIGGIDCAWIAGLAQWMLGLTVYIINDSGEVIYEGNSLSLQCNASKHPQIIIQSCNDDRHQTPTLVPQQRMFRIPQGGSIFLDSYAHHSIRDYRANGVAQVSDWSHILIDTFGCACEQLLEPPSHFGQYLVAVSQRHRRKIRGNDPWLVSPWSHPLWIHENSRGRAFLHFAAKQLPELRRCIDCAMMLDDQDRSGYQDSHRSLQSLERQLEADCDCSSCRGPRQHSSEVCLRELAETIVCYLWLLVPAIIDKAILPSRKGLLRLLKLLFSPSKRQVFGYVSRIWKTTRDGERDELEPMFLEQVPALFLTLTGLSLPSGVTKTTSAIAASGLCIYYRGFSHLDGPPPDVCSIVVIPGYIEHNNQTFKTINDLDNGGAISLNQAVNNNDNMSNGFFYDLLIKETELSDSIEASFTLRHLESSQIIAGRLLPLKRLADVIALFFFQLDCQNCKSKWSTIPTYGIESSTLPAHGIGSWFLLSSSFDESSSFTIRCSASARVFDTWALTSRSESQTNFDLDFHCLEGAQLYHQLMVAEQFLIRPSLAQMCDCLNCMVDILMNIGPPYYKTYMNSGQTEKCQEEGSVTVYPLRGQPSSAKFQLAIMIEPQHHSPAPVPEE